MVIFATWLTRASKWLAGAVGACALLLLCAVVITRYFFPHAFPDWGTEVIIYLTIWALFLSIGELALNAGHVNADFVVAQLSTRKQRVLGVLATLMGLTFSVLFFYQGYAVVEFAHMLGEEGDSTLRFPKWIYYLALPTGMALQCIAYLTRLWCELVDSNQLPSASHSDELLGD